MKYLTVVYSLPDGFDVATLTQHEFASAFAWSHKMDECNGLTTALEKANETDLWRCTVCGRTGTVGRCCGEETREPVRAPNV